MTEELNVLSSLRPARNYPAFGYGAPHPGARGTSTLLKNVLLSTHYGRSDSCPPQSVTLLSSACSTCGQVSLIHAIQPSDHSVSNHLRRLRLARARYPSAGRTETASLRELGASPLHCRLATSRRPNRVQFPPLRGRLLTDWSFTSCCSPPRVATTQLQSVTGYVDLERTFTSQTKCALRRTVRRLDAAFRGAVAPRS
jgi:hypothetical protein